MSSRVSTGRREAAGAPSRYRGASVVIVDGSGAKGFGRGAATKAMLGFNPVSTMPNYSVGLGVNGAQ